MVTATAANANAQSAVAGDADASGAPFVQYRALLELWRRKALQHNMARLHAERALAGALGELKEVRNDLRTCSSTHAAEMLAVKESCDAQSAAATELATQLSRAQDALRQETEWRVELEQRVRNYAHSFANMKLALVHHRDVTNSSVLEAQVGHVVSSWHTVGLFLVFFILLLCSPFVRTFQLTYAQAMQRLEALMARVTHAAARVRFASGLLAQKEVHLRNDAAALEAERRLLRRSAVPSPSPSAVAVGGEDAAQQRGPRSFISRAHDGVSLHPDAEALLRALFLSLDHDDCGAVAAPMLLQCVAPSSEGIESEPHETPAPSSSAATAAPSAALASADVAALGHALRASLGQAALRQITDGLQAAAAASVTWGEFLLMIIPDTDPAAPPPAALSVTELATLRRKRLLLDTDCGVVPLDVKFLGRAAPAQHQQQLQPHQREEIRRLAAERTLLQARLQEASAALERRAEGIKGHFEGELQRARVREGRLASENAALRSQVEAAEARAAESDASFKHRMAALTERVDALECENKTLTEALTARKSEEVLRLEQALRAEVDKLHRLDVEHNLLQREASKREIRCRGLQRDVLRLQTALAASQQELLAVKDTTERRVREEMEEEKEEALARRKREQEEREQQEVTRQREEAKKKMEEEKLDAAVALPVEEHAGGGDDDDAPGTASEQPEQRVPHQQQKQQPTVQAQVYVPATAPPRPVTASVAAASAVAEHQPVALTAPSRLGGNATDIYSTQLSRLLRLAEDAIGNP
jgi:hypothetical protein